MLPQIEWVMKHVVVLKRKPGREWSEMLLAPGDHSAMPIDTEISCRPQTLLDQLACEPPAAAAEIEHRRIGFFLHIGKNREEIWIIKEAGIGWTDESSEFDGRHWKIGQRIGLKDVARYALARHGQHDSLHSLSLVCADRRHHGIFASILPISIEVAGPQRKHNVRLFEAGKLAKHQRDFRKDRTLMLQISVEGLEGLEGMWIHGFRNKKTSCAEPATAERQELFQLVEREMFNHLRGKTASTDPAG